MPRNCGDLPNDLIWLVYIINIPDQNIEAWPHDSNTFRNKHRVTIYIEEYILKLHIHQQLTYCWKLLGLHYSDLDVEWVMVWDIIFMCQLIRPFYWYSRNDLKIKFKKPLARDLSYMLCWCICNFGMYYSMYLMYCNPMFIPGCFYYVFKSCGHAPMFRSGGLLT